MAALRIIMIIIKIIMMIIIVIVIVITTQIITIVLVSLSISLLITISLSSLSLLSLLLHFQHGGPAGHLAPNLRPRLRKKGTYHFLVSLVVFTVIGLFVGAVFILFVSLFVAVLL